MLEFLILGEVVVFLYMVDKKEGDMKTKNNNNYLIQQEENKKRVYYSPKRKL